MKIPGTLQTTNTSAGIGFGTNKEQVAGTINRENLRVGVEK